VSGKRVRGQRRERNRDRRGPPPIARSEIEPMEGALAHPRSPLTRVVEVGLGRVGRAAVLTKDRTRPRTSGDGAPAPALTRRQRVSEVATSGSAPSAERRRGSAANEIRSTGQARMPGPPPTNLALRPTTNRNRSCHGEKPWHPGTGAAARTVRSATGNPAPNADATPCRKRGVRGSRPAE
jgi:hypothetical protein